MAQSYFDTLRIEATQKNKNLNQQVARQKKAKKVIKKMKKVVKRANRAKRLYTALGNAASYAQKFLK